MSVVSGFGGACFALAGGEVYARRREKRLRNTDACVRAHELLFRECLSDEIKACRARVNSGDVVSKSDQRKLSIALERIGYPTYRRLTDEDYIFGLCAPVIVSDWVAVANCVERLESNSNGKIGFRRRHAKWLALKARVWLHDKSDKYQGSPEDCESMRSFDKLYKDNGGFKRALKRIEGELGPRLL